MKYTNNLAFAMKNYDWKEWMPNIEVPDMPDIPSSIVEFNVNRLNHILDITSKTLRNNPEYQDKIITITSAIHFGPVRLSVTLTDKN